MPDEVTGIDDFDELLAALQAGEEWAAATLFGWLQPPLLRYLRWQEPAAAEDLAGETWVAVAEGIRDFQGDAPALRGWVFAIARRRLADHRRRSARRRTDPVPSASLAEMATNEDLAGTVAGELSAQEAIAQLTAALNPEQAEIIVLRVVGGLSVEEVARLLGKRPGSVRVAQHRALRRLARHPGMRAALAREV